MASFTSFQELDCWKEAVVLRRQVRQLSKNLPSEEKYKLADQIVRSSRSVTANIAEGFGRFHYQDNSRFCRLSRGSLYETMDHLILAREENYIDAELYERLIAQTNKCINVLNGYIRYLLKAKHTDLDPPEKDENSTQKVTNA